MTTPDFDGYITSSHTSDITRSVELRGDYSCAATPTIRGHGFASTWATGCVFNLSSTGSISISPSSGKVLWSTPASVHIWGVQYVFDEARVSPTFATGNSYTTNIPAGSLTFPEAYSANDSYQELHSTSRTEHT